MCPQRRTVRVIGFGLLLASWMVAAVGLQAQTSNGSHASRPKVRETSLQELRVRTSLNSGWLFKRQASPGPADEAILLKAEQPGYDDSSWVKISLPHTWDAAGDSPFPTTRHFRGIGWYRRKLDLRPEWRGRRVAVDFKGVFQVADVWVNGNIAGRHVGGFTGFQFDVTAEIVGPGVSCECREVRDGAHIHEDHFVPEIIDPDTGEPLPPGREGELVFTPVTKEALPLIRYRTGDIAALDAAPCACGRTTVRMSRVRGRRDDMLIIRGVNLYPSEVERIVLGVPDLAPHYQLIVERPGALDELTLVCEPARDGVDRDQLRARLAHELHQQAGITVAIHIVDRDQVPRSEGKAVRVVDRRPR